jgi:hypothetical protein
MASPAMVEMLFAGIVTPGRTCYTAVHIMYT